MEGDCHVQEVLESRKIIPAFSGTTSRKTQAINFDSSFNCGRVLHP